MAMNMEAMLRIKADVQGENNIRRLGNSMQGLQGQAKNVAMSFNGLKGAVAGFGAAIAGSAIVGGLTAVVKKSIDAGDELFNLQQKTGIAAVALTGIGNAAKLADVDMGALGKGINKLNLNLVKAAEGNADMDRRLKQLGVTAKDSNGQLIPTDKALKQIADKFADMPDGAKKAEMAVALFGKAGAELIPLLNEGAASMEKFTYKISDDFAARSDLFNDTLTEFGIKTQGFGMELTDALLPALQSIIEVFGELFDSKTDWTDLFNVIKFGIRSVAAVLLGMVKLVDEAVRLIGSFAKRAALAFKGDFAGAQAEADRFGADFMKRFQANMGQFQRLFTDAPSPGTGRRRGRDTLDMTGEDARRAAESKRAATEAERLQQRRNTLTQQLVDLQESLRRKVEDANAAFANVGGTPVEKLLADRAEAIRENDRTVDDLTKQVVKLFRDIRAAGGEMDVKPLEALINQLSKANVELANQQLTQGLKDLLPSLDDYDAKIREVQNGKKTLTEVEKLNAQINLLQLDILAATNPALAEHIRLLRDRAAALDDANKKQKEQEDSFGANFADKIKTYYQSISNFGAQVGDAVVSTFQGLEDQLTNFVMTGKANFADLANSIIADITRIAIRQAIIKPLVGGVLDIFGIPKSAMGNVFAQNGIQKFARGGIVDRPTLFPFAKGTGLMGEAGPEAIMPLRRGRDGRLGVEAANGGGGVSVVVNVDAQGTSVQGDSAKGKEFGRVISEAVKNEIVIQKRPGGLLA